MAQFIKPKFLSVVVPVRNEEDNVTDLIFEIRKSLKNKIINIYEKFIDTLKIDNILSDRDVKREYIKSVLVYKLYINHENDKLFNYFYFIIFIKIIS